MDVSVIMACCNQGDWVRRTVPLARESLASLEHEIIVVDDQSTDGCCHGLGKNTLIVYARHRLGVSGARRLGYEVSTGDIVIFSDPHCEYPNHSLFNLARIAAKVNAIYQPITRHTPEGTRYAGGKLTINKRGLVVAGSYEPVSYPALYNTIYAMSRQVYDGIGGWPPLPGVWGCNEQALTLMAWFSGVPILVDEDSEGIHYLYQKDRKFPFSLPRADWANNVHWVHAAFFPETYNEYWKPMITEYFGDSEKYDSSLVTPAFTSFQQYVQSKRQRTEEEFFNQVLGIDIPIKRSPLEEFDRLVASQHVKSAPTQHNGHQEVPEEQRKIDTAIRWMLRAIPGCIKNRSVLSVGVGDMYPVKQYRVTGVERVEGIDITGRDSKTRKEDITKLSDAEFSWDIVSALNVLNQVPDPAAARSELVRVLSRQGWLFLTVPQEMYASESDLVKFLAADDRLDQRSARTVVARSSSNGKEEIRAIIKRKSGGPST